MKFCKVCNSYYDSEKINLSDGGFVHVRCISDLDLEVSDLKSKQQSKIYRLNEEHNKRERLGYKIKSFLFPSETEETQYQTFLISSKKEIDRINEELNPLKQNQHLIYNLYLSYPPDWDERRNLVIDRDGERCKRCSSWQNLHLHHKVPLSKGGTNEISNLVLLCRKCHSKQHGGKDLSGQFHNRETAFSKRIKLINQAITENRKIQFLYKKSDQKNFKQRTIRPYQLINIDHNRDEGFTLCVKGYCDLRKADRHFALKRMKNLRIL